MDPCKPLSNRSICKLCCLRSPEWQFEGFFPSICTDTDQRSGKMVVLASTFQGSLRARPGSFQTKAAAGVGGGGGGGDLDLALCPHSKSSSVQVHYFLISDSTDCK